MHPSRRHRVTVAVAAATVTMLGCSGDGTDLAATPPTGATTTSPTASGPPGSAADGAGGVDASASTDPVDPADPDPTTAASIVPSVAPSVVEVPETGVPGLDSEDRFCAAWSRFAGSFQVIAVTAAFGDGPPEQLATLEVLAAPVVTAAFDELLAAWPAAIAAEADVAAELLLGPLAGRLDAGVEALAAAGASDGEIDEIADAWIEALARRDPSTPDFAVDLSDELWAVVDAASDEFRAERAAFVDDPSLVTGAETPLTDEYLARVCPDQGTLGGGEVEAG